jgi:hypothetical protein
MQTGEGVRSERATPSPSQGQGEDAQSTRAKNIGALFICLPVMRANHNTGRSLYGRSKARTSHWALCHGLPAGARVLTWCSPETGRGGEIGCSRQGGPVRQGCADSHVSHSAHRSATLHGARCVRQPRKTVLKRYRGDSLRSIRRQVGANAGLLTSGVAQITKHYGSFRR